MKSIDAQIRHFYENYLREYWIVRYEAYLAGKELAEGEFETIGQTPPEGSLPAAVAEALAFYKTHVEDADIGSVRVWAVDLKGTLTYAVRTTTDGDDGWLEIFGEAGEPFGAARTYIELCAFGNRDAVRAFVITGGFPPELEDRITRTLWGKHV